MQEFGTSSQEHTSPQYSESAQKDSKVNMWKVSFIVLLVVTLMLTFVGYYFITQDEEKESPSTSTISNKQQEDNQNELLTVNSISSIDDERGPYFTFQVKYPSEYFVTSNDMITDYRTQGGRDHPKLIFTKNTQQLGNRVYQDIWSNGVDCILIWSTSGFSSMEDFHTLGFGGVYNNNVEPETITREQITVLGDYQADKRIVKYPEKQSNNVEVFVQLPENVAYHFQTCNMNSEEDLDTLLDNFKVRGLDMPGM